MMISAAEVNKAAKTYLQRSGSVLRANDETKAKGGGNAAVSDRVDFSDRAQEMQKLKSMLSQIPDVRFDRINKIRVELEKGSYTIDSQAVAEQIVLRVMGDIFVG